MLQEWQRKEGADGETAKEGEARTFGRAEVGQAKGGEMESEGLSSSPIRSATLRAVRKTPSRPPRPVTTLPVMDDAMRAEHLLERLFLPHFWVELRGEQILSMLSLLDIGVGDW